MRKLSDKEFLDYYDIYMCCFYKKPPFHVWLKQQLMNEVQFSQQLKNQHFDVAAWRKAVEQTF